MRYQAYFVMTWMSKHTAAILACKPVLVVVDQHVVVEAVLSREGRITYQTNKRLNTCKTFTRINSTFNNY